MRYFEEQAEWDQFVHANVGAECELINVSTRSTDSRVYASSQGVFKIRRLTPASLRGRRNSLEDEYLVLKRLSGIPGVPRPLSYLRKDNWELLRMEPLPKLHGYDPTLGQPRERLRDFWDVLRITAQVNRLGCSHGDLHLANAGRNVAGSVSVFDFDQSCVGNPWRCRLRDFLGMPTCDWRGMVSLLDRARHVEFLRALYWAYRMIREALLMPVRLVQRLRGHVSSAPGEELRARVGLLGDPHLALLAEAWDIAARANASAPGIYRAYYSLDVAGTNFPGERPWALRWERIQRKVDFRGKRFLELGCNIGLLSIHARARGAAFCMGVDIDNDVLDAARLAARAFSIDIKHRQFDLDDSKAWEAELKGFDLVSALSVMHWVRDKSRVWAFLAQHSEVLYEGHEPEMEAYDSLVKAGFNRIEPLGPTERNRQVFHALRN